MDTAFGMQYVDACNAANGVNAPKADHTTDAAAPPLFHISQERTMQLLLLQTHYRKNMWKRKRHAYTSTDASSPRDKRVKVSATNCDTTSERLLTSHKTPPADTLGFMSQTVAKVHHAAAATEGGVTCEAAMTPDTAAMTATQEVATSGAEEAEEATMTPDTAAMTATQEVATPEAEEGDESTMTQDTAAMTATQEVATWGEEEAEEAAMTPDTAAMNMPPAIQSTMENLDTGSRHTIWCFDCQPATTHSSFLSASRGPPLRHVMEHVAQRRHPK